MSKELSFTQARVMRHLYSQPNHMGQIAGHQMAPFISSARSLVRKGLLLEYRTSQYSVTDEGKKWINANPYPTKP